MEQKKKEDNLKSRMGCVERKCRGVDDQRHLHRVIAMRTGDKYYVAAARGY